MFAYVFSESREKMNKKITTRILLAGFAVFTLTTGILYTKQIRLQQSLAGKVLRFHVRANSDSEHDQELKLKVRDAVGGFLSTKISAAQNLAQCEQIVDENMDEIIKVAEKTVQQEGDSYPVTAKLEMTSFPVKSYGDYTFPSGKYEALNIRIGEGKGHNWWCVMYPNLCFSGSVYEVTDEKSETKLREVLSEAEIQRILSEGSYKIHLKYLPFLDPYLEKLYESAPH